MPRLTIVATHYYEINQEVDFKNTEMRKEVIAVVSK